MRSYNEMVLNHIRQMSEDNQQLMYLKDKVVKGRRHAKALEESFGVVTEKLRKTMEENRIVRLRAKMQHEENKEEVILTLDSQTLWLLNFIEKLFLDAYLLCLWHVLLVFVFFVEILT